VAVALDAGAARRRLPVGWFRLDQPWKRGGRGGTDEWNGAEVRPAVPGSGFVWVRRVWGRLSASFAFRRSDASDTAGMRDHADRRLGLFAPKLMMARRLAVSTTKFQIVFGNSTRFSFAEFNFDVAELFFINKKYGGIIQWRNRNVYRSSSPIFFYN
jgi:hypothetical protein